MNIKILLLAMTFMGTANVAAESLTLLKKLEIRKNAEISVKERVAAMSESVRADLVARSERLIQERCEIRMDHLEGMREDKTLKNREDMFRPDKIPRYYPGDKPL
jgi:hypothetical protein